MITYFNKYWVFFAFLSIFIVYFCNLFIDVMEVDAAQYASISLEMLQKGSYLQVFHRHQDYLDKPPMLFWLSSLSFKFFGSSNWAYKLPSVLALLAGVFATFKLGKLLYNQKTGIAAALILASTQALFLITNDVRTDGILLGFTILSIWQYVEYERSEKLYPLFFSAIFLAAALMAKGPIALIIFLSAIGFHLITKKQWNQIFHWKWLPYFIVVFVLLLPMTIGLYQQFDLHPEKTVYGLKGPSGVKFFYWTQSFGRITGDIYWKNNTSYFTFLHTFLWDFQPWALLAVLAFLFKIIDFKQLFTDSKNAEFLAFGGFFFPFLALSLSKFKLPHYIFPLFPYMAIILANFIICTLPQIKYAKSLLIIQFALLHVFYLAIGFSYVHFFDLKSPFPLLVIVVGLILIYWMFFSKKILISDKLIGICLVTSIAFSFNLSTYFYPQLLEYQSETVLGKQVANSKYSNQQLYSYNAGGHSLDFYSGKIIENISLEKAEFLSAGSLIYTDENGKNDFIKNSTFQIVETYLDYPVTQLNINFLNKLKRYSKVKNYYLLQKN
jgi:4-amino-4-deoxy-L-arabinose transferase-like glycosyltransferase